MPTFNPSTAFNPGNDEGPYSGYATNINVESELKNQIYALQKCSQAVYVPSSNSDLYDYTFKTKTQSNPHDLLFKQEHFSEFVAATQVVFHDENQPSRLEISKITNK